MVNPPSNNDDFYARALASFNSQISLINNNANTSFASEIESHAKSLVEDDLPKIDSAVKSYLSLVAARSAVASDIDVLSASALLSNVVQCTFAVPAKTPMVANRCALVCARTLLSSINSTIIPPGSSTSVYRGESNGELEAKSEVEEEEDASIEKITVQFENNATLILWNRLVQSSKSSAGDKSKQTKPSKVLGRLSLKLAYPFIQERFRRGVCASPGNATKNETTTNADSQTNPLHSFSNEALPPVNPPKGIDIDQWEAFYKEFGHLLNDACCDNINGSEKESLSEQSKLGHNDSALIWSCDRGSAELLSRRNSRAQRASEALGSVEGAKAMVADALGAC